MKIKRILATAAALLLVCSVAQGANQSIWGAPHATPALTNRAPVDTGPSSGPGQNSNGDILGLLGGDLSVNSGTGAATVNSIKGVTVGTPTGTGNLVMSGSPTINNLNATGTITGNITGNAGTASVLSPGANINGTPFTGGGNITVTAAANTLTGTALASGIIGSSLTSVGTIGAGIWQGTPVADGFIASAATWNAKQGALPAGTTTTVLHGNASGSPTYGFVALTTDVSGVLPLGNGGFGITSGTSGGVPYFSSPSTVASSGALGANALVLGGGAGAAPSALGSLGTTTTLLHGNAAGAPTFGAVNLTTDVTGVLPIANGGFQNVYASVHNTCDVDVTADAQTFFNATGGIMYLQPGCYIFSSSLTKPSSGTNFVVKALYPGTVTIEYANTAPAILVDNTGAATSSVTMSGYANINPPANVLQGGTISDDYVGQIAVSALPTSVKRGDYCVAYSNDMFIGNGTAYISSITNANPAVITLKGVVSTSLISTTTDSGLVTIQYGTGSTTMNGNFKVSNRATTGTTTTFTLLNTDGTNANSTGWGTYTGGAYIAQSNNFDLLGQGFQVMAAQAGPPNYLYTYGTLSQGPKMTTSAAVRCLDDSLNIDIAGINFLPNGDSTDPAITTRTPAIKMIGTVSAQVHDNYFDAPWAQAIWFQTSAHYQAYNNRTIRGIDNPSASQYTYGATNYAMDFDGVFKDNVFVEMRHGITLDGNQSGNLAMSWYNHGQPRNLKFLNTTCTDMAGTCLDTHAEGDHTEADGTTCHDSQHDTNVGTSTITGSCIQDRALNSTYTNTTVDGGTRGFKLTQTDHGVPNNLVITGLTCRHLTSLDTGSDGTRWSDRCFDLDDQTPSQAQTYVRATNTTCEDVGTCFSVLQNENVIINGLSTHSVDQNVRAQGGSNIYITGLQSYDYRNSARAGISSAPNYAFQMVGDANWGGPSVVLLSKPSIVQGPDAYQPATFFHSSSTTGGTKTYFMPGASVDNISSVATIPQTLAGGGDTTLTKSTTESELYSAFLVDTNNLSDLTSAPTALTNLGFSTTGKSIAANGSLTSNAIVLGGSTGALTAVGSLGTTSTVLHGNVSGAPSFGAVALATDVSGTLQAAQFPTLAGDVTTPGSSLTTTIANNAVTNAKLATMPTLTLKGNSTGGTAAAADLTPSQAKTLLSITASDVANLATVSTTGTSADINAPMVWEPIFFRNRGVNGTGTTAKTITVTGAAGVNTQTIGWTPSTIPVLATKLVFANFDVTATGEADRPTAEVWNNLQASLNFQMVNSVPPIYTFNGASSTTLGAPQSPLPHGVIVSDPLNYPLPANNSFGIRTSGTVTGTVTYFPAAAAAVNTGSTTLTTTPAVPGGSGITNFSEFDNALGTGFTSSVGSTTKLSNNGAGYSLQPTVVLGLMRPTSQSIAIMGDSIDAGFQGNNGDNLGNVGWLAVGMGNSCPWMEFAKSSTLASGFPGLSGLPGIASLILSNSIYITDIIVGHGRNDLQGGATASQTQANVAAEALPFQQAGFPVHVQTLPPWTASTDAWTTQANQFYITITKTNVGQINPGDTTFTASGSSGVVNGQLLASSLGTGIAPGTTITISGTTITLSIAATGTIPAGTSMYFGSATPNAYATGAIAYNAALLAGYNNPSYNGNGYIFKSVLDLGGNVGGVSGSDYKWLTPSSTAYTVDGTHPGPNGTTTLINNAVATCPHFGKPYNTIHG